MEVPVFEKKTKKLQFHLCGNIYLIRTENKVSQDGVRSHRTDPQEIKNRQKFLNLQDLIDTTWGGTQKTTVFAHRCGNRVLCRKKTLRRMNCFSPMSDWTFDLLFLFVRSRGRRVVRTACGWDEVHPVIASNPVKKNNVT